MKWFVGLAFVALYLLGFQNVQATFRNTGGAIAQVTGGFEPGHGLPSKVAVPLCSAGWSDIIDIPVGKSYVYTANVVPVVQKKWLGRWQTVPANDMSPNQAVRFCTEDPFNGAFVQIVWSNI